MRSSGRLHPRPAIKIQIQYRPTDSLIPYARNAKQHPAEQIAQIAGSLKEFGFINPVIVDAEGSIVAGHGRVLAAQKLGLEEVPTLAVEHLTPTQVKAFRLADNRIAQNGEWDTEILKLELEELDNLGVDLEGLGFGEDELPSDGDAGNPGNGDPDDVPETPTEVWVKPGDLFQLGEHRLLCGDSTKREDVGRLMGGEKADMVFTDPPYGIDYQDVKKKHRKIENDTEISGLLTSLDSFHGPMFICCNWRCLPDFLREMSRVDFKACIVWDKTSRVQNLDRFGKQHEFILYAGPYGGQKTVDVDVWQCKRDVRADHPTAKPVEIIERAFASTPAASVFEPFCGSGSTLIACEKTGRRCYGMEIDPQYCQVILDRWSKFSGKQWAKIE